MAILLNYLNKKKGADGESIGVPVERAGGFDGSVTYGKNEESKTGGGTLY
jgi:hypothetical protein